MSIFVRIVVCLILLLFSSKGGFAQKSKRKERDAKRLQQVQLDLSQDSATVLEVKKIFFRGSQKFVAYEYEKALEEFRKCERLAQNNASIKYKIAHCLYQLKNFSEAEIYMSKALSLEKQNKHFYPLSIEIYSNLGKYDKVIEVYKLAIKNFPNHQDWYFELANSYLYLGNFEDALKTYQEAEKIFGVHEDISKQKIRVYETERKFEQAIKESQKLIDAYPNEIRFMLDHADLLFYANRPNEAQKILETISLDEEHGNLAKLQLAFFYARENNSSAMFKMAQSVLPDKALPLESRLELVELAFKNANDSIEVKLLPFIEDLANQYGQIARVQYILGDFLQLNRKDRLALKAYKNALELDANLINVWFQVINLELKNDWIDELIEDSQEAISTFPQRDEFYYFAGIGFLIKKDYQKAKANLEQCLKLKNNEQLELNIKSSLADIYHHLGEHELSDQAFEAVLSKNPNDTHALNNYSYFLSQRGEKLDLAKTHSAKLVALYPENPTYLDTHGWVLYTLGQYEQAEPFLRKAVSIKVESAVINEHYGDVLFRLGKREQALIYWQKAKDLGGSEDEEKLKDKLTNKKID